MKRIFTFPLVVIAAIVFVSCEEKQQEDITNEVNKDGSIESSVTVDSLDNMNDVLITKHAVWVKGTKIKDIEYRDTVPTLGSENKTAENSEGDTKTVVVKKDYEIFITVK